jgi:D-alanine-D-alanine ligase
MKVVILYNLDERLISGEYGEALAELSLKEEIDIIEESLGKLGYEYRTIAIQNSTPILSVANLIDGLKPDCVFNLVEAINGNSQMEMALPAMLDLMKIPYTGSNALTLGLCQDKAKSKAILKCNNIQTPSFEVYGWDTHLSDHTIFPSIVKPLHEDGSLGISEKSIVKNHAELAIAVYHILREYRQESIVEEYIDGREFGIGVIDFNGGPIPFPVSEIVFDGYPDGVPKIVSYNSKWNNETVEYKNSVPHCPADVDPRLAKRLQDTGLEAFKIMGCRGYARVDIRMRGEDIFVIEVNPNCDIAPGSGIFKILKAAGITYEEFVKNLVEGALRDKERI